MLMRYFIRSLGYPGCSLLSGDPPRGGTIYLGSGRCCGEKGGGGGGVEVQ